MKFNFFDVISMIGHSQHQVQLSINLIKILMIIQALQWLAIMLPDDGWGVWVYNDGHLSLMKTIAHAMLVTPLLVNGRLNILALSVSIIVMMGMFMLLIFIIMLGRNLKRKTENSKRSRKSIAIYYFMLFSNSIVQLPLLSLFGSQIFCGSNSMSAECYLPYQIINGIGLTILSGFVLIGQYFLRSYTFQPFNRLQLKYDLIEPLLYLLNISLILIFHLQSNNTLNYLKIALFNIIMILQLRQTVYSQPQLPILNKFKFIILLILESNLVIISISIITLNEILNENNLIVFIMILQSMMQQVAQTVYPYLRQYQLLDIVTAIGYTQELYESYQKTKEYFKQQDFFKLQQYIEKHLSVCDQNCKSKNKSKNHILLCKPVIFCVLSNELERAKKNQKIQFEELQLVYVSYLSQYCKKPLLGFVELKKYEILLENQTYYFQKMCYHINEHLQELICRQQSHKLLNQQVEKQLEIEDIMKSLNLSVKFIPQIMEVLEAKINLWTQQIKGLDSIYDLEDLARNTSKKIQHLTNDLQSEISINLSKLEHIQLNTNVIEIKVASLYFSGVVNDYYSTQICEQTIGEIFNIEHTLLNDIITNLKLVDDKVCLIMLSMVKNRGQIVNTEKKALAEFFGYDDQEFLQIVGVTQLMPSFIADVHDQLLFNFLQTARSSFFQRYNQIFSMTKLGFLQVQQLKIDNNFSQFDDYVLVGCMSQIKQELDYVIFGDDGRILGLTKGFYDTIIFEQDQTFSLQRATSQLFIFMLFPTLINIIQDYRSKMEQENLQLHAQDFAVLLSHENLRSVVLNYQNQNISVPGRLNSHFTDRVSSYNSLKQKQFSEASIQETNKMIYSLLGQASVVDQTTKEISSNIALFNLQYQYQIQQFIRKLEGSSTNVKYVVKFNLYLQKIGKGISQKQYFVMEIHEIRKKDLLGYGESLNLNTQSLMNNKNQSNAQISGFSIDESQMVQEITPNLNNYNNEKTTDYSHLLKRYANKVAVKVEQQLQDSARDSFGPLSQRVQFINPESKQIQMEDIIEQEFLELQVQQIGGDQMDMELEEQSQQQKDQSSSQVINKESNQLLKMIQTNQKRQGYAEKEEMDAQKSRSSATSGTSGISAIQIIKKFQMERNMISSLQVIMGINVLIGFTLLIYMIIHLIIITSNNKQTIETIDDINGPMLFNRYFCKLFSYSWSLIYNALKIVDSSDFIINTIIRQLQAMQEVFQSDLANMYPTFINVEQRGLFEMISLDLLYTENENVTYTYFVNFIQNSATVLFTAMNYDSLTIDSIVSLQYMDNLLTLRYNLKNVVKTNTELINSINEIFFTQLDARDYNMQIQIIVEIIVIGIIFFIQLYFWKQIENYIQQVLLLAGRLQETQAQDLITRTTFIKQILTQNNGKQSWKKQNYYYIGYQPLTQIGIEQIQSQSRVLREFQYKSQHISREDQGGQKKIRKNLNVVLNSRIYRTQISILTPIILVFSTFLIFLLYILGGYLIINSQSLELQPSQELIMNYIKFTSQFDILVTCALAMKTQPLMYDNLIEKHIYTQADIDSFRDQKAIVKILIQYMDTYNQNLTQIYTNVLNSKKISDNHKNILFQLYEADFCLTIPDLIRFCGFDDANPAPFIAQYGKFAETDDNREFLSQGIIGVVSKIDTLIQQIYQTEINTVDYNPDKELILRQVNTKEFTNGIIQHFIDTNDGTSYFLDVIQLSIKDIMANDLQLAYVYYLVAGLSIETLFIIFYLVWIHKTNQRLIQIRLSLVNLPIEILTESHTLSLLKRLN